MSDSMLSVRGICRYRLERKIGVHLEIQNFFMGRFMLTLKSLRVLVNRQDKLYLGEEHYARFL